jgi:hypothetical protein
MIIQEQFSMKMIFLLVLSNFQLTIACKIKRCKFELKTEFKNRNTKQKMNEGGKEEKPHLGSPGLTWPSKPSSCPRCSPAPQPAAPAQPSPTYPSRYFHARGVIVFVHPGKQLGGGTTATGRAKMCAAAPERL